MTDHQSTKQECGLGNQRHARSDAPYLTVLRVDTGRADSPLPAERRHIVSSAGCQHPCAEIMFQPTEASGGLIFSNY
jgi:hypothetical protein